MSVILYIYVLYISLYIIYIDIHINIIYTDVCIHIMYMVYLVTDYVSPFSTETGGGLQHSRVVALVVTDSSRETLTD